MAEYGAYGGYPPAPADPYAAAYAGYGAPAPYHQPYGAPVPVDEVRTLYISGFPDDVKEREVNNLLRFLPGYEASQMNRLKGQPQGFALFASGALARAAIDAIQHLRFDEGSTLRCEMARKNMYIRDEPALKRPRYAPGDPYGAYPPVGPPSGTGPASGGYGTGTVKNTLDNPPCNTLFIGNLSDTVSEAELQTFFSSHPGYRQLKLTTGAKGNVNCFVEFEDTETAQAVHTSQQGAELTSSNRGGIRIQYSKNPLGRKRDASGAEIMGPPGVN